MGDLPLSTAGLRTGHGLREPKWPGVIEAYRAYLPISDDTPVVTLLEGGTPLVSAPHLAETIGAPVDLFLKYEGLSSTRGSIRPVRSRTAA